LIKEKSLISRNPKVGFGRYCVRDTMIPVTILKERFRAGDTFLELLDDYDLHPAQLNAALRFRGTKNAKNS